MTSADASELARVGPRVDVEVSPAPPVGQRSGRIVRMTFLVDTGADVTVVSQSIVDALRIAPVGEALVAGVTDTDAVVVPVYRVRLALPGVPPMDVDVGALGRDDDAVQGLLGRDALALLRFTYDGPRGAFTLSAG